MPKKNFSVHEADDLVNKALYFEYSTSANPIGSGLISEVPFVTFPSSLHEQGPTRILPLDISDQLGCPYPATSPALLANFVRIKSGEQIKTNNKATSHLFYVIRGNGKTQTHEQEISWSAGDFFILPFHPSPAQHTADADSAFYYVHDEPLLNYLGVEATIKRFKPTLYTRQTAQAELKKSNGGKRCENKKPHECSSCQ